MDTVLQRTVFPLKTNPDVLPLYVDSAEWGLIQRKSLRLSAYASTEFSYSRFSATLPPYARYSFGSYFNAFPAAYWQRWTIVTEVDLTIQSVGIGSVIIYKSNSRGESQQVTSLNVSGNNVSKFSLPLNTFSDGGWYWFDLLSSETDFELQAAFWSTSQKPRHDGLLSVGITTFNKPEDCVGTLETLANDSELLAVLDTCFVIDQGTQLVSEKSQFSAVRASFGPKLRLIRQHNLGGSGGFSRVMHESVSQTKTAFTLLLDDDIEAEPESIIRAYRFASFAREVTIVGGHMFDRNAKTVLHAWAETVSRDTFTWGPSFKKQSRHDFDSSNLRQTPWMHARLDADYNGWWMCLIPNKVIQEIGYSLPIFIKWDDAEFALRARQHGYRTVSMPGVSVWHVSWLDKDDSQDWQVFFHTRNRIIAGLLHGEPGLGRKLLRDNWRQDVKKLINMQYYATQLSINALDSVLRGPESLHGSIMTAMQDARKLAEQFPETKVFRPSDTMPNSTGGRVLPSTRAKVERGPEGLSLLLFASLAVGRSWFRKSASRSVPPELDFPKSEAKWWKVPQHSSVLVGTADGSGKMWFHHDQRKFRRLLIDSLLRHLQVQWNWKKLSRSFRLSSVELSSPESWAENFGGTRVHD